MNYYIAAALACITYVLGEYMCQWLYIPLVGSLKLHISGISCMAAVAGTSVGATSGFGFLILKRIVTAILYGHVTPNSFYLPTIAASWYWIHTSWIVRCGIPLICMVLFLIHPVGYQAGWYSCYWLIPVGLYYMSYSPLADALGSAFIAHAVGSVLWIYSFSTTPEYWYVLMPFVLYERCMIAGMMLVMRVLVQNIEQALRSVFIFLHSLLRAYTES